MNPTEKAKILTNLSLLEQRAVAVLRALLPKDSSGREYLLPGKKVSGTGRLSSAPQLQELPRCCVPTAEEEVLLATGEYTPEELWGGPRPTCPKCIKSPE